MVMTDPIADYLTRIRNANMAKHSSVEIPASNIKKSISEILKREGFIRDYEVTDDNKQGMIKIFLKYGPDGERVISGLKRWCNYRQGSKTKRCWWRSYRLCMVILTERRTINEPYRFKNN